MPDSGVLKQLENFKMDEDGNLVPKPKRGRPKGSKDKQPRKKAEFNPAIQEIIDPATGIIVGNRAGAPDIIRKIGDEKVSAFVAYHMQMMQMRQGCNKKNVPELYQRFFNYLSYCAEKGIMPNNMNAYYAIGISKLDVSMWKNGQSDIEHQRFAEEITGFFASVHEQAPTQGLMNPISAMFWQKAHDGMIEAQKLEVINTDPLGEKASAEQIVDKYKDVLPE